MTRGWLVIGALALSFGVRSAGAGDQQGLPHYSDRELLKNWALAHCLSRAFPRSPIESDAAAAAAGYLEKGSARVDAYQESSKLADQFLARKYLSQSGQQMQTMKCIDLFYSHDLDRLAKRYTRAGSPK